MNEARFIHTEYVTFVLHFSTFSSLTILLVGKWLWMDLWDKSTQ